MGRKGSILVNIIYFTSFFSIPNCCISAQYNVQAPAATDKWPISFQSIKKN